MPTTYLNGAPVTTGVTVQSPRERESAIMHAREFVSTINEQYPERKLAANSGVSYSLAGGWLVGTMDITDDDPHKWSGYKLVHVRHLPACGVCASGFALEGIHYETVAR